MVGLTKYTEIFQTEELALKDFWFKNRTPEVLRLKSPINKYRGSFL
jgi:hypothetical protein